MSEITDLEETAAPTATIGKKLWGKGAKMRFLARNMRQPTPEDIEQKALERRNRPITLATISFLNGE